MRRPDITHCSQQGAGERVLGDLVEGDLVGSALLLSGVPADVDATATEAVRAMRWEAGTLERLSQRSPGDAYHHATAPNQ